MAAVWGSPGQQVGSWQSDIQLAADRRKEIGQSHSIAAWGALCVLGAPTACFSSPEPCRAGWYLSTRLLPAPRGAPRAEGACCGHSSAAQPDSTPGWRFPFQETGKPCWGQCPQGCPQGPTAQQHHHNPRQWGSAVSQRVLSASRVAYPASMGFKPSTQPITAPSHPRAPGMWVTRGWRCPVEPGGRSLQPGGSSEDPSSPQSKSPQPRCPRMAPLLTGEGRAASPGARTGLPRQPTPHAMAREGSHHPSLPPQPRHMCFQCGWELQGVGVLRKQHQIPFRSSNGPQQPSRGRAGGGDARTLQDRAGSGGIPD